MAKTPTKKMKNRALALMAVLFAAVCNNRLSRLLSDNKL